MQFPHFFFLFRYSISLMVRQTKLSKLSKFTFSFIAFDMFLTRSFQSLSNVEGISMKGALFDTLSAASVVFPFMSSQSIKKLLKGENFIIKKLFPS